MPAESMPAVRSEEPASANSDARVGESSFESGVYTLTPITRESDANSDALVARIDFIPGGYRSITNIDSIGEAPRGSYDAKP